MKKKKNSKEKKKHKKKTTVSRSNNNRDRKSKSKKTNKVKSKKTSGKKRIAVKSKKKTIKVKYSKKSILKSKNRAKVPRKPSRYNNIQRILSSYLSNAGIKIGKGFQPATSIIYENTKGHPLKYISQNIEQIYKEYIEKKEPPKEFSSGFPFFQFSETIKESIYSGIKVIISFTDPISGAQYDFDGGTPHEAEAWYRGGLYAYLRQNYNDSPVALFVISDTDNKTYVEYTVITGEEAPKSPLPPPPPPPVPPPAPVPPTQPTPEQQIEIERQKAEAEKQKAETEKQKAETERLKIEYVNKRIQLIEALKSLGMTNEQIIEELKKS